MPPWIYCRDFWAPDGFAWWARAGETRLASDADPEDSVLGWYVVTDGRVTQITPGAPAEFWYGWRRDGHIYILKHWGFDHP